MNAHAIRLWRCRCRGADAPAVFPCFLPKYRFPNRSGGFAARPSPSYEKPACPRREALTELFRALPGASGPSVVPSPWDGWLFSNYSDKAVCARAGAGKTAFRRRFPRHRGLGAAPGCSKTGRIRGILGALTRPNGAVAEAEDSRPFLGFVFFIGTPFNCENPPSPAEPSGRARLPLLPPGMRKIGIF